MFWYTDIKNYFNIFLNKKYFNSYDNYNFKHTLRPRLYFNSFHVSVELHSIIYLVFKKIKFYLVGSIKKIEFNM